MIIHTRGGYFTLDGEVYYYINDYQGNICKVVDKTGRIYQKMDYYPYGEPFQKWNWDMAEREKGMSSNRYLFSGNERETGLGVNQYDFQARTYVASFPRLTSPDPLASKNPGISGYSYCLGDPINLIDPEGEIPSNLDSALMCAAVYNDNTDDYKYEECIQTLENRGWTLSKRPTSAKRNHTSQDRSGLQAALFEKTTDGITEYAYVYAGTDSLEDGLQDVLQLIGMSSQYDEAVSLAKIIDKDVGNNELTFLGHSLGGGLAAISSLVTGRHATTFNPAAISNATMSKYGLENNNNIGNFRTVPLGTGNRIGGCGVSNLQDNIGLRAIGFTCPVPVSERDPYKAHKINNFLKAFGYNK